MNKLILTILLLSLVGCAGPVVTEYIEVKVPVKTEIDRPVRPEFTETDTIFTYLPEVLNYTKLLESIIDLHNESIHGTRK